MYSKGIDTKFMTLTTFVMTGNLIGQMHIHILFSIHRKVYFNRFEIEGKRVNKVKVGKEKDSLSLLANYFTSSQIEREGWVVLFVLSIPFSDY